MLADSRERSGWNWWFPGQRDRDSHERSISSHFTTPTVIPTPMALSELW